MLLVIAYSMPCDIEYTVQWSHESVLRLDCRLQRESAQDFSKYYMALLTLPNTPVSLLPAQYKRIFQKCDVCHKRGVQIVRFM